MNVDYASLKAGMRPSSTLKIGLLTIVVLIGAVCASVQAQDTPASELKGMPPRVAPSEYQAQAQAGAVTVAAEFMGHSVPTPEGIYTTEDYVVVEAGLFGAPQARAKLSIGDFSLRISGKKTPLPTQPYELVFKSLKDPEWEPPKAESKSKTSIGGGGGGDTSSTPAPVHMPIELRRTMERRVQKASMLEGDRALPQAGLLFFEYRGKTQGIRSLELIYTGPAGNATLALQP
jgi:hypothetical protein